MEIIKNNTRNSSVSGLLFFIFNPTIIKSETNRKAEYIHIMTIYFFTNVIDFPNNLRSITTININKNFDSKIHKTLEKF